jgi:hypothetical protein
VSLAFNFVARSVGIMLVAYTFLQPLQSAAFFYSQDREGSRDCVGRGGMLYIGKVKRLQFLAHRCLLTYRAACANAVSAAGDFR